MQCTDMGERQILLINYDFPPGLSGVRRIVKFARFLPEFGWSPMVLCANPDPRMPLDTDALRDVEKRGYPVYRTRSFDPYQLWSRVRGGAPRASSSGNAPTKAPGGVSRAMASALRFALIPDDRVGWVPFARREAERIIARSRPDAILTSSYPNSTHLVGVHLKRRFGIPWVADFRDSWTTNPYIPTNATPFHSALNRRMERDVAREADALLTVSEPIAAHLREIARTPARVHVIPNGFDDEDLAGIEPEKFDRFTFAYTGTLFPPRTPEPLLMALRQCIDARPEFASHLQVVFMSRLRPEQETLIGRYGLESVVRVVPLGTHREALGLQLSADALLTIDARTGNSETMLTQKVFEYLAAGKPILAIAPEGALADLLAQTGSGMVVAPEDTAGIARAIRGLVDGDIAVRGDPGAIARYHRRELTRQLAAVLDAIV